MQNLSPEKTILIAALVLLMASYWIKKFVSFPYLEEICERMKYLVIPIITIIINYSEGPGGAIIVNIDNQGNNAADNEDANDLANEGNKQEAIPPDPANQDNQINEGYD